LGSITPPEPTRIGEVVMFGQPIAGVAQRVGVARQIDAVAQRRGRFGARGDDRKVEDGERNHGFNLVRRFGLTKGPDAQIRRASVSLDGRG
jgi:hypothetical protein